MLRTTTEDCAVTQQRSLLSSGDKSILREALGEADIAHGPREARDEPG
jgi:hypothetical protein